VNLNRPTYSILYFHDTLFQNAIAELLFIHKNPKMFCIHDKEKTIMPKDKPFKTQAMNSGQHGAIKLKWEGVY